MQSILFVFVFLGLMGCGKFSRIQEGTTGVRFSVNSENPSALLPGVMVYAVNAQDVNRRGAKLLANETIKADWFIPNGTYQFYGVAYSGAGMTGTMYCGRANSISLTGGTITIPLDLRSTGQCGTGPFAPPSYNEPPNPDQTRLLYVGFCAPSGGDMSLLTAFGADCDAAGGRPAAGGATRIKISLEEYARWDPSVPPPEGGPGGKISSACLPGAAIAGSPVNTNIRPPYGDPFVVTVEAHGNTTCSSYLGSYTFINGIAKGDQNPLMRFRNASDQLVFPTGVMMRPTIGTSSIYSFFRNY